MDEHAPDPRQEALAEVSAFVETQLASGFDADSVVTQLEARGLTRETAQQLVQKVRSQAALPAQASAPAQAPAPDGGGIMGALIGGAVAAVVGGLVWGLVARITGWEIGFLAWGVGLLAGVAVVTLARGQKGVPLQVIAVASALAGILIGKYFTFVFIVRELAAQEEGAEMLAEMSIMSAGAVVLFLANIPLMLSGYDLLWVFLAVGTAWGIPKAGAGA